MLTSSRDGQQIEDKGTYAVMELAYFFDDNPSEAVSNKNHGAVERPLSIQCIPEVLPVRVHAILIWTASIKLGDI